MRRASARDGEEDLFEKEGVTSSTNMERISADRCGRIRRQGKTEQQV